MRPVAALARIGRARTDDARTGYGLALAYLAWGLVAFLVFLVATLPHQLIATRALDAATAGTPLRVEFKDVSYAFPNGYRFEGVRVAPADVPETVVQITELTLRVPLLSLLIGNVSSATLRGAAYGGSFRGDVRAESPQRLSARLAADTVDLGRLGAAFATPPAQLGGRVSLELELAGDGRTTRSADGDLTLHATSLAASHLVVQGFPVPDLAFSDGDLTAQIRAGHLQVKELRAIGPELEVSATGDVLLRDPLPSSVLSLRLNVNGASATRPETRVLLGLLPRRPPGEPPSYTVSGTLAAPILR